MFYAARHAGATVQQAREIVNDTITQAMGMIGTLVWGTISNLQAFLYTMAENRTYNLLRDDDNYQSRLDTVEVIAPKVSRREREALIAVTVHRALAVLTPVEAYVAWARWACEESIQEIIEDVSKEFGLTWNRWYTERFLNRTEKLLRKELIRLGGDKL